MPDMTKQSINSVEDDPHACGVLMRTYLRPIGAQFRAAAMFGALSISFAELILERGGSDELLLRMRQADSKQPPHLRIQVRECHAQVETMISSLKRDGFSLYAILWAVMGKILVLQTLLGISQDEIDSVRDDMITQINEAQRLSVN